MRFLAPHWLWALAILPVIYLAIAADEKRRREQFAAFAAHPLWSKLAPEIDPSARLRKAATWLAAFGFAVLAMARPQWGTHEETVHATGLDVMIALDVSNSMETEDVVPSRLKKARHLIKTIADRLEGDRVGVVAFAASSYVACPLTTDLGYVMDTVQILGPKMVTNQGTDIGLGLDTARKALERGAEEAPPAGASPEGAAEASRAQASRVVVLISDGEDHEGKTMDAAKEIRDGGGKLYVFGLGTEKGGPIPMRDEAGNLTGYKKDRSGQPVVSTFHPDALMQVASAAGGRYWNVTPGEAEVEELLKDMGALNRTEYAERRYLVYEDRFQFPLAIAVLLLLLEITLPARRLRGEDAAVSPAPPKASGPATTPAPGPWRPGRSPAAPLAVLAALLMTGFGLIQSRPAFGSLLGDQPPVSAYLDNEKGLKAFNKGKIDEAKKEFGSAQALDPNLPELKYNQGVVQAQEGDLESAARGFGDAAKGALERGDDRVAGESLYNLGEVLAKKGDVSNAIRSYLAAIGEAQRGKDQALEDDARKNLQLLIQQQQQKKQQQQQQQQQQKQQQQGQNDQKDKQDQQQQGGQQQDKKDDKDQDKDKNNQNGQGKNSQDEKASDGPKRYQDSDSRKQKFKSQKLSDDDAERVMSELSDKEKELQARIKKQHGNSQPNQKDW